MENTYKETFDRFAIYLFATFLSPMLFAACFAFYLKLIGENSWTFLSLFILSAIFTFPVFLIGAIPVSLVIDFSKRGQSMSVLQKGSCYAGCGGIMGFLAGIWVFGASETFTYLLAAVYGVVGGFFHFIVLSLLKKMFR